MAVWISTFLFCPLFGTATEDTDYSIEQGPMHVLWARGQTELNPFHRSSSGIETGVTSDPEFYGRGEIKYHGHGSFRGYLNLDLTGEPNIFLVSCAKSLK